MTLIPPPLVRKILDKTDLRALVAGPPACCPFSKEETHPLEVALEEGWLYCPVCRKGGTALDILMDSGSCTFEEALAALAQRLGSPLELDKVSHGAAPEEILLGLLAFVRDAFRRFLEEAPQAEGHRQHLKNLGLSGSVIRDFSLGWAPAPTSWLLRLLLRAGYSPELLGLSGLFSRRSPRFPLLSDRLTVPITDEDGRPVAFAGLRLDGEGPRWLQSSENELFRRSEVLFAFDRAREAIRRTGEAVVCEGFLETMTLHDRGVTNAVGLVSDRFSLGHAQRLRSIARRVSFCFEADEPGTRAADQGCAAVRELGLEARQIEFPRGKGIRE